MTMTDGAPLSSTRFDFLRIEADLAMTFIGSAKASSKPENSIRAIERARVALEQVRRGIAQPEGFDAKDIAFLERRCGEIKSALEDYRGPRNSK